LNERSWRQAERTAFPESWSWSRIDATQQWTERIFKSTEAAGCSPNPLIGRRSHVRGNSNGRNEPAEPVELSRLVNGHGRRLQLAHHRLPAGALADASLDNARWIGTRLGSGQEGRDARDSVSESDYAKEQQQYERQLEVTDCCLRASRVLIHHLRALKDFTEAQMQYHAESFHKMQELRRELNSS
uniref:NAM-associated domain-containing protein n=1 Tax=Macrostomum lignano TaxID=282301 RepID=A0A1I8FMY0_9PLAT